MVLNDTVNLDGIYQEIDFLCGTNATIFTEDDKKRMVNSSYEQVQQLILQAMGSWDENQSLVSISLTDNTRSYSFASSYLQIKKVQIDFGDGKYVEATPVDERNLTSDLITESEIQAKFNNNNPKYQLIGDSIKIYSGDIDAVTDGVKIWTEIYKDVLDLDADVPKIPDAFHEILALGPAIRWAIKQDNPELERSLRRTMGRDVTGQSKFDGLLGQLQIHYSNRLTAQRAAINPRNENYE